MFIGLEAEVIEVVVVVVVMELIIVVEVSPVGVVELLSC